MLPDAPPYMKWDEEIARQLTDFNKRLQHLERLERSDSPYTEGARVYSNNIQAIPNNVITPINFELESYDTDTIHDNVINNTRLTCKTAGKYIISLQFGMIMLANKYLVSRVRLNGATIIGVQVFISAVGVDMYTSLSTQYDLAINDFIEGLVQHNNGGATNLIVGSDYSPVFMMQKIG